MGMYQQSQYAGSSSDMLVLIGALKQSVTLLQPPALIHGRPAWVSSCRFNAPFLSLQTKCWAMGQPRVQITIWGCEDAAATQMPPA
jgi:hypothetical protein